MSGLCNSKFWLENPLNIFCDYQFIPSENMPLEKQLNTITRLVLFISLILFLLGFKQTIVFLLFSLILIIILYYIQRANMQTQNTTVENYTKFYAGAETQLDPNRKFVSLNQSLVGPANPKTFIKPLIITPALDITRRVTERNVPSGINKRTVQYLGDSGYYVKNDPDQQPIVSENFRSYVPRMNPTSNYPQQPIIENYQSTNYPQYDSRMEKVSRNYYQKINLPKLSDINTGCGGYNPENVKVFAPVNIALSEEDKKNPNYNDDIYTQYLQPNIYTRPQVEQFPVWNMGISFQEPIYPVSKEKTQYGDMYVERDPNIPYEDSVIEPDPYADDVTQDEIYDPRLTGYGSQSRAYIEPKTGQPRYMYKDIDAARNSNFFVRSNVDHLPFAQQTGLMKDVIDTNIYKAADAAYIDQNSQFRVGLQQSLMSKRNAELGQLKQFPMRRDQGGCKNIR